MEITTKILVIQIIIKPTSLHYHYLQGNVNDCYNFTGNTDRLSLPRELGSVESKQLGKMVLIVIKNGQKYIT